MPPSKEALGMIGWLTKTGVPFKVTSEFPATPGVHSTRSYHYRSGTDGDSLAVDFAGIRPGWNSPELRAIYNAFVPVRSLLAELLGPGDKDHEDHVHVAVPKGTFLVPFPKEVVVPDNPELHNITGPLEFHPVTDANGFCWGYYIFSSSTGEVHAYGDPQRVKYWGRSEVLPA